MAFQIDPQVKVNVAQLYENGATIPDICMELDLRPGVVQYIIREAGMRRDHQGPPTLVERMSPETLEAFVADYQDEHIPVYEVIKKYKLSGYQQMYVLIQQLGMVPRTHMKDHVLARASQMDHAVALYQAGYKIKEIIEETGIPQPTLHAELHRRGIGLRNRARENWKERNVSRQTGTYVDPDGPVTTAGPTKE